MNEQIKEYLESEDYDTIMLGFELLYLTDMKKNQVAKLWIEITNRFILKYWKKQEQDLFWGK